MLSLFLMADCDSQAPVLALVMLRPPSSRLTVGLSCLAVSTAARGLVASQWCGRRMKRVNIA